MTNFPFSDSLPFYPLHHPGAKEASQEAKVSSREEQTQGIAQDDPPQETEHTTTLTAGDSCDTAISSLLPSCFVISSHSGLVRWLPPATGNGLSDEQ